jgi:hypothetical protein
VKSANDPYPVKAFPYLPNCCPQIIALALLTDLIPSLFDPNFKDQALEKLVNIPKVNSFKKAIGLHARRIKLFSCLIIPNGFAIFSVSSEIVDSPVRFIFA